MCSAVFISSTQTPSKPY